MYNYIYPFTGLSPEERFGFFHLRKQQGFIFFCLTPPKILPNNMLGGKKWLEGDERKGENAYFSPNWWKIGSHLLNIINLIWRQKYIYQEGEGGGQKMNFKFNIHPWKTSLEPGNKLRMGSVAIVNFEHYVYNSAFLRFRCMYCIV